MFCMVLVTVKDQEQAQLIAQSLVAEHLVACVNIVDNMQSVFFWQGQVCNEKELLLIMKTKDEVMSRLIERVKELHSYSVPEIISLPIAMGNNDYLKWIAESVKP